MRFFGLLAILFTFIFSVPVFAQDATSDFTVRFYAGTDSTPPSVPTLLTATGTAPTQIDLTWSSSTDDVLFSGYVVFRDGSAIATTTLTSYSDTGLTASTTYTYYVRSYDFSSNYSTSSNSLDATTPDYPPEPVPDPEPESTAARVVADVSVIPGYSTSSININAPHQARFIIRWGRSASYELGFIATEAYKKNHSALITDLEPGTVYEYEIIGITPFGRENIVKRGRFRTVDSFDLLPPANVSFFEGFANGADVRLRWVLPADEDLSHVRIVRSHLGFPLNPYDGVVVFQGRGTEAVDEDILLKYSPVYYTAFAYDEAGNVSSGAVVVVYATSVPGDDSIVRDYEIIPLGTGTKRASTTFDGSLRIPELFEIEIQQRGVAFTFEDDNIQLIEDESFLISVPVQAVEQHLKSLIVTLQDPTNNRRTFSFLLRLNKDQSAYEALVAPLMVSGRADILLDIYDYQAYVVVSYEQTLSFVTSDTFSQIFDEKADDLDSDYFWHFALSVLAFLFLFLFWIAVGKKKHHDEDKNE